MTWLDKNSIISVESFKNAEALEKKTSLRINNLGKNQSYETPFTFVSKEESFYKLFLETDSVLQDFIQNNSRKEIRMVDKLYSYYFNNYIVKMTIDFYVSHMMAKEYKLSCGDPKVDKIILDFLNKRNFFEKKQQYLQQLLITGDVFLIILSDRVKFTSNRLNPFNIFLREVNVTEISKNEEERIIYIFNPDELYESSSTKKYYSFKENIFHLKIFSFLSEPFGLSLITSMIPYIEKYNMYDMLYMFAKVANMKKIMISIPGDNKDPLNTMDRLITFRQQFKETVLSTNESISSSSRIDAFNQYMFTTDDIKFEYLSMPNNDQEFSLPDLKNQQEQLFNLTGLPKSLFLNDTDTAEQHGDVLEQQNEIFATRVKSYENAYAKWVVSISDRIASLLGYDVSFAYTQVKSESILERLSKETEGLSDLIDIKNRFKDLSYDEGKIYIDNLKKFNYSDEFTSLLNDLNENKKEVEAKENQNNKSFNEDEDFDNDSIDNNPKKA